MLLPRIRFSEEQIGAQPIRQAVRNRIGLVGEFSRGPSHTFSYLGGLVDFSKRFGLDRHVASQAVQAIFDQGAEHVAVIRVTGRAKQSIAQLNFSGTASGSGRVEILVNYRGEYEFRPSLKPSINTLATSSYLIKPVVISGSWGANPTAAAGLQSGHIECAVLKLVKGKGTLTSSDDSETVTVPTNSGIVATDIIKVLVDGEIVTLGTVNSITGGTVTLGADATETLTGAEYWVEAASGRFYLASLFVANDVNVVQHSTAAFWAKVERQNSVLIPTTANSAVGIVNGQGLQASFPAPGSLKDGQRFAVGVFNKVHSFETVGSMTALQIAEGAHRVALGEGFSGAQFNNDASSVTFTVNRSLAEGFESNRVRYSARVVGTTGISITNAASEAITANATWKVSFESAVGGVDGPVTATRVLYTSSGEPLVALVAASEGDWANNLQINVVPGLNGRFQIRVKDPEGSNFGISLNEEAFTVDLDNSGLGTYGEIRALEGSKFIRGLFLPKYYKALGFTNYFDPALHKAIPQRTGSIDTTASTGITAPGHFGTAAFQPGDSPYIQLQGGADGPAVTDEDYLAAIDELGSHPCHIILCPGRHSDFIRNRLQAVAESSNEIPALKIAVVNAIPGLRPETASAEGSRMNSTRVVMVAGWCTYASTVPTTQYGMSPDALYAGKLASIPFFASPAARRTSGSLVGIIECDLDSFNSQAQLQIISDNKLEIIAYDPISRGYSLMTGQSTSSDTSFDRVSFRRSYDVIRADLFDNLQHYRSEPNNSSLMRQLQTSINTYMSTRLRQGHIASYSGTIIEPSNDSLQDYLSGNLNIAVSFLPLYAADYINVSLIRSAVGSFSFQ